MIAFMLLGVSFQTACFPAAPECVDNSQCAASTTACMEMVCVARECVEQPVSGGECDADAETRSDVLDGEVAGDSNDRDALAEVEANLEVDPGEVLEVDAAIDSEASDSEVVAPECDGPEDCVHLSTACVEGSCDERACVAIPLSEGRCDDGLACTTGDRCVDGTCEGAPLECVALDVCHAVGECNPETGECSNPPVTGASVTCDDGLACTTDDECSAGACTGVTVVCTALDQCHDIGTCQTATGVCTNPNKSNTTECDDGLKCTIDDTCTDGECGGAPVECVALDQCHEAGACDPETGECSNPAKPDTTPCDDGLKCTELDACVAGTCTGAGVVCVASDQCHRVGVCEPATGLCSDPPQTDGVVCDDQDACSVGDACSAGICFGPNGPLRSEVFLGLVADDRLNLVGVGAVPGGGTRFSMTARATRIDLTGSANSNIFTEAVQTCASFIGETRSDGSLARFDKWMESPNCTSNLNTGLFGLHVLGDLTTLVLGLFREPFTTVGGKTVGSSANGLVFSEGAFVARLGTNREPIWSVSFLGFDEAFDGMDLPSISVGATGVTYLALNFGDGEGVREIVNRHGVGTVDSTSVDANVAAIFSISPAGDVTEFARFVGNPAQLVVRGIQVTPDGTVFVAGFSTAAGTVISTATDSAAIPTGVASNWEAWLVAFNPDATIRWTRHFFAPPGGGADPRDLYVVPGPIAADNDGVWFAMSSVRYVRARVQATAGTLLGGTADGPHLGEATVIQVSAATGEVSHAALLGPKATTVSSLVLHNGRPLLLGTTVQLAVGGVTVGDGVVVRPFVARPDKWVMLLARSTPDDGLIIPGGENAYILPRGISDGTGGAYLFTPLLKTAVFGDQIQRELFVLAGTSAQVLARVNANGWRDCP